MIKKLSIAIIVVLILVGGIFWLRQSDPTDGLVLNERQNLMIQAVLEDRIPQIQASNQEEAIQIQRDYVNLWVQLGGTEEELAQLITNAVDNKQELNLWKELKNKLENR